MPGRTGTLTEIAEGIATRRHALFIGAGLSFSSGVPTVGPFRLRIMQGLGLSDEDISRYEQAKVPFESFFEVLMSVTDCEELFQVFHGERPSLGHKVAALLAKSGLVQNIITTNFDMLLEAALEAEGVEFNVYASEHAFASLDWRGERVRLIKLHGTIEDAGQLAITIRRVAARQFADIRGKVVRDLFEHERDGGVIILGYSCSDHFDVSPAARTAARSDRQVMYVLHDGREVESATVSLAESMPNNPFSGFSGFALRCNTDDLLQSVMTRLCGGDSHAETRGVDVAVWEQHVDVWLSQLDSEEENSGRLHLAGLVLKSANLWSRSNDYLLHAIENGLSDGAAPRALLAIGNNYRDLGKRSEARTVLEDASERATRAGQLQSNARILNSLGMIAEDEGDNVEAIARYLESLGLAHKAGDRELEGKCHGNLGIAYKNRGLGDDFFLALGHHTISRDIAIEIGDKRSEGRTLGNIGLVYRSLNDVNTACRYYDAARTVAESLGDLLHVGIWLHNAGEDLELIDPLEASDSLKRSNEIFLGLGQNDFAQQSEAILSRIVARRAG